MTFTVDEADYQSHYAVEDLCDAWRSRITDGLIDHMDLTLEETETIEVMFEPESRQP